MDVPEKMNLTGFTGKDERESTTGDIVINSMTPAIEKETKQSGEQVNLISKTED